ncbi:HD domain-containing protein [Sedimentibacter sp. zth1]|uniref:HD domain-containing protein n=1 Tax=Sedimentibacter sp. zth1 TaxID=2816908 RepID=UPI001A92A411|nr:HD domain-containing protein [Sedimentibacter sp. zth1]QSX05628.1 HD domain-containing protein [Sedimentibacter sp. zth1]
MKNLYSKDIKKDEKRNISLMLMKKVFRENEKTIAYLGDKTGEVKSEIIDENDELLVGDVLELVGILDRIFVVESYKKILEYDVEDYLSCIERPIEEIMDEINLITNREIISKECKALNDYFFNDSDFLNKFKKGIAGVRQHHNYRGGLAEHTLNVMYLSTILAKRYECNNREITILGAKLHDIGKIEELFVDGPFSYTLRGEIEGHIVIGVSMLEEAFKAEPELYNEDFKERMKGCIIQHHGKMEYGSPRQLNMEEAYIVHYADYIDATMNKISQIKKDVAPGTWSEYDRRIGTKLYL